MIGELVVAATSADVLLNLNKDEVTRLAPASAAAAAAGGPAGAGPRLDKVVRLAQHVLEQGSLFPQFPAPPAGSGAPLPTEPTGFAAADAAVPLELAHYGELDLPCAPDILLLPSKLKPFARAVAGTLIVNPGTLCRGNYGGTYAKITVAPPAAAAATAAGDEQALVGSAILERARVQVVRI